MPLSSWFVFAWLLTAGARAAPRVLDPAHGAFVVCKDKGVTGACCDKVDAVRPLCVVDEGSPPRCRWEPLADVHVNVSVLDPHTLLVECAPEVDVPLGIQLLFAAGACVCTACLRGDIYDRYGVLLL